MHPQVVPAAMLHFYDRLAESQPQAVAAYSAAGDPAESTANGLEGRRTAAAGVDLALEAIMSSNLIDSSN
jgi:hypothetical protein